MNDLKMEDQRDHGYAWVALAAMVLLTVIFSGTYGTLGIFIVEFLSYFNTSKTTITWIGAVNMFVGNVASVFAGILMRKYGCRPVIIGSSILLCLSCVISGCFPNLPVLYIFFGVLQGIGFNYLFVGALVSVQQWFNKRRSLASGILMTGMSLGLFMWPPLTRWLIDLYHWQGALIVLGAMFLHGLVSAFLLRQPPKLQTKVRKVAEETSDGINRDVPSRNCQCSKQQEFTPLAMFLIGETLLNMGHSNMLIYTPVRATDLNINPQEIPLLISVIGIAGLICRPLAGWMGDRRHINRIIMYGLTAVFAGGSAMISTQFRNMPLLITVSVAFGISSAGYVGILGAVLVDVAGIANIEIASGLRMVATGIGNVLLNAIAGAILDLTGNSNILFWIFGATELVGGIIIILIPFVKDRCLDMKSEPQITEDFTDKIIVQNKPDEYA